MVDMNSLMYAEYRTTASKNIADRLHFKRFVYMIGKYLPRDKNANIVDLGAGAGENIAALINMGYKNIVGVDISSEQVHAAVNKGISCIVCEDVFVWLETQLDDSYDVVTSFDLVEHLTKDEIVRFFTLVRRKLAVGGVFVVRVPNSLIVPGYRYSDFTHETAFTSQSIRQVLSICGFKDIDTCECAPEPISFVGIIRNGMWKLMRFLVAGCLLIATGSKLGGIYSLNLLAITRKQN